MAVIVSDAGFTPADIAEGEAVSLDALLAGEAPEGSLVVDFPNDRDPAALAPFLDRLALVRVVFPAAGDGRGFSIGHRIRDLGYRGRLRALGPVIADQWTALRAMGFDEAEIPDALAARQPAEQWRRRPVSYQARIRA